MRIARFMTAACLMLMGTIVFAQDVSYDFDRTADFSRFKTYAWVRGTTLNDELNHRRIINAVDAQLAARGFSKVETGGNPDVFVAYHATFDKNLQINGFSTGWGGYRFGGNRSGTATVEEIAVGTLTIDMVDARTKTIVWRATATKEIDPRANAQKRERNINKAAEKLFKNYPPGK